MTSQSPITDREAIADLIQSVGYNADQRNWAAVEQAFADRVVLDYTSSDTAAAGQSQPDALTPREIVDVWQTQLPGYEHTQHIVSVVSMTVNGDKASAHSNVFATHFLPNDQGESHWMFVGTYDHEIERTPGGWRIRAMRANKRFELGNSELPKLASARVKAGKIATGP